MVPTPARWIFLSGQCSFRDGVLVGENDIETQVEQTLENLISLLKAAGASTANVVKLMAWVTDASYAKDYARIRTKYFTSIPPASTTVVSALVDPRMLIEVEAIATTP
ncbi:RidA family protein [Luethyella okanaganae]|uniref:RidA family protein n=1 Tax=Luethyella okanaganae TaxID=69372 RepID=A0ABW1VGY1_9MICO